MLAWGAAAKLAGALREYPIIGLRDFVPSAMADQSCSLLLRTVFQERPVGLPRRATLGHWRVSSPPLATIASSFAIAPPRSEEHTSELQSLMRISYAVFCLKNKKKPDNYQS